MLPWLVLILAQLVLLAGCAWVGRTRPRLAAAGAGLLLLTLVAKAWLHWRPDLEAAAFPFPDYARWQGAWLWLLAAAFFGFATTRIPARRDRRAVAGLALAVVGISAWQLSWLAWPEHHGDGRTADAAHHLRQSTAYTCAPSSCAMLLAHLGIVRSEREMAELCLTRREGTGVFNIYRALRLSLPEAAYEVRIERVDHERMADPGFLAVGDWPALAHAVCLVGQGGSVLVHDPLAPEAKVWPLGTVRERLDRIVVAVRRR